MFYVLHNGHRFAVPTEVEHDGPQAVEAYVAQQIAALPAEPGPEAPPATTPTIAGDDAGEPAGA